MFGGKVGAAFDFNRVSSSKRWDDGANLPLLREVVMLELDLPRQFKHAALI